MTENGKSERNLNTQLPSAQELSHILAAEAQREFPEGKEDAHYPDFAPAIAWFQRFDLPTELFERDMAAEDLGEQKIVQDGKQLVDALVEQMLAVEPTEADRELFDRVYDYLSEEDDPKRADLIFVFGSKTPVRIEKAMELYRKGLSNRLMISGGNPFYGSDNPLTEAERYKQLAVEQGIPGENIITENKSITIPDNVRSSLNLLDEQGVELGSIILVNSPYTQRRGWVHFKKYLPESVDVVRVNADTIERYHRDKWFSNEDGVRTLANEFVKMKVAATLNTA